MESGPRHIYRRPSPPHPTPPARPAGDGASPSGVLPASSSPAADAGAAGPLPARPRRHEAIASSLGRHRTASPVRAGTDKLRIHSLEEAQAWLAQRPSPLTSVADCHQLLSELEASHEAGGIDLQTYLKLAEALQKKVPAFNRAPENAWQTAMDTVITAANDGATGEQAFQQAVAQAAARHQPITDRIDLANLRDHAMQAAGRAMALPPEGLHD
jgi:hypothetical protein